MNGMAAVRLVGIRANGESVVIIPTTTLNEATRAMDTLWGVGSFARLVIEHESTGCVVRVLPQPGHSMMP